ncbi:MAG: hypothetical protein ACRDAM_15030 [Casimicrobium sp.]
MKTGLQLKLAQHLTLTPQLQQSIRLLQLSTLELQQEIATAIAENPLLELEDADESPELSIESLAAAEHMLQGDAKLDSDHVIADEIASVADAHVNETLLNGAADAVVEVASPTDDIAQTLSAELDNANASDETEREVLDLDDWGSANASSGEGDDGIEWQQSRNISLQEHLLQQVPLLREGEAINAIIRVLIESLDDNGFLIITLEETAVLAQMDAEALREDWEYALSLLQSLEPAGVGARDLRECLLIQLQELKANDTTQLAYRM